MRKFLEASKTSILHNDVQLAHLARFGMIEAYGTSPPLVDHLKNAFKGYQLTGWGDFSYKSVLKHSVYEYFQRLDNSTSKKEL
jgi:hypothetical protein